MIQGMFTGKKLSDYFNAAIDDPVGARRIISGTDKAQLIAGYHKNFPNAINASQDAAKVTEAEPEDAKARRQAAGSIGDGNPIDPLRRLLLVSPCRR